MFDITPGGDRPTLEIPKVELQKFDLRLGLSSIHHDWHSELLRIGTTKDFINTTTVAPGTETTIDHRGAKLSAVNGIILASEAPWLIEGVYEDFALKILRDFAQQRDLPRPALWSDRRSAVTLNVALPGQRMDRHVDRNRFAFVIYATFHPPGDGGATVFGYYDRNRSWRDVLTIYPRPGFGIAFCGDTVGHEYTELVPRRAGGVLGDKIRIAVNMNFKEAGTKDPPQTPLHEAWYRDPATSP